METLLAHKPVPQSHSPFPLAAAHAPRRRYTAPQLPPRAQPGATPLFLLFLFIPSCIIVVGFVIVLSPQTASAAFAGPFGGLSTGAAVATAPAAPARRRASPPVGAEHVVFVGRGRIQSVSRLAAAAHRRRGRSAPSPSTRPSTSTTATSTTATADVGGVGGSPAATAIGRGHGARVESTRNNAAGRGPAVVATTRCRHQTPGSSPSVDNSAAAGAATNAGDAGWGKAKESSISISATTSGMRGGGAGTVVGNVVDTGGEMVACPICNDEFPESDIERHATDCLDRLEKRDKGYFPLGTFSFSFFFFFSIVPQQTMPSL